MRTNALAAYLMASIAATPAHALCVYDGQLYAKTTVAQEFRDARWVVVARVEREDVHYGGASNWIIYRLRTVKPFKGAPAKRPRLFTFQDSGGFYPDVGADYLLFLNPPSPEVPSSLGSVVEVNYACGQSRPWRDLSSADRRILTRLAARR